MGPVALLIAAACSAPGAGALPAAGAILRADVDGDRRVDTAAVRYVRGEASSCGFRLTVRTRGRIHSLPVRPPIRKALTTNAAIRYGEAPALRALAEIDRRPGAELLVEHWRGASSHGGSVYALRAGRLRKMRIRGSWDDEFGWWGSIAHNANVDCVGGRRSGRVATRSGSVDRDGRRLVESRSLLAVRGDRFERVRSRSRTYLPFGPRWWTDVPDVGGGPPFARCTVASAPGF